MSATFDKIRASIAADDWRASEHALQRLEENGIIASDLADGIASGEVIEEYDRRSRALGFGGANRPSRDSRDGVSP